MKKYAFHKFYGMSDECRQQVVIVVDEGKFCDSFPLREEEAFTEWRGGVAVLSGRDSANMQLPASLDTVLSYLLENPGYNLWHIDGKDYSSGIVHHVVRLR